MPPANLLSSLLGLLAAASWGAGDFSGGLATRRAGATTVVVWSQTAGGLLLALLAAAFGEAWPRPADAAWGALGGLAGAVGLLALYRGLAQGRMGIVAPLTAITAAVIPVVYGALVEGAPTPLQRGGFLLALLAVWLLTRAGPVQRVEPADLGLAGLAGLGIGVFFVVIGRVSETAVWWPLVAVRLASISTLLLLRRRRLQRPTLRQLPLIALAGVLDAGGNALFALAARFGRVDTAAILASLYPAATILLARLLLQERIGRLQLAGIAAALAAIVLIAADGSG